MSLLNEIQDTLNDQGIETKEYNDMYSTGIDIFNYRNAQYSDHAEKITGGISAGSLNTFIGRSGSGKTSIAIQIAKAIVEPYEDANIIHFDFEHSTTRSRVVSITGWDPETFKNKYLFLNSGITTESFYSTCKAIAKLKKEKREELLYDTGMVDAEGEPIMELQPTVIILDSIATMYSDNNADEDEMGGQMSTTAQAKLNNQTIKRLVGSSTLTDGNIIILAINHITTKIEINAFSKKPADINYLKQDESLPGKLILLGVQNKNCA